MCFSVISQHHDTHLYFFFLMIRRPPRSTLFPYTNALPISGTPRNQRDGIGRASIGALSSGDMRPGVAAVTEPSANRVTAVDRKSTRLNSSHANISYAVFCLKKKKESPLMTDILR